ncbi:MAG: DUF4169 family protein [Rhodospirillaceae bacterium]
MAAEIVNLNKIRKAKARLDKKAQAAENRTRFGRSKAEKQREKAEQETVTRLLDGAKRDSGDDGNDPKS